MDGRQNISEAESTPHFRTERGSKSSIFPFPFTPSLVKKSPPVRLENGHVRLSVCLICLPSCQVREDCSHLARISAEVKRCNRRLRLRVSWEGRRDRRVSVLWRRRRRWPTDEYWLETGKEGKIGRGFREVEADRDVERKLKVGKDGRKRCSGQGTGIGGIGCNQTRLAPIVDLIEQAERKGACAARMWWRHR